MQKIIILFLLLFVYASHAQTNSTIEYSKIIEDKIAQVNMKVNFNYTNFINKFDSKQSAINNLELQLAKFLYIDQKRIDVTDVRCCNFYIDFYLLPRISDVDTKTIDILNNYDNGKYTINQPINILWLSGSTATYTLLDAYQCNNGDVSPTNYTCVYNYQFTEYLNPENNKKELSETMQIVTLVLVLFFVGLSLLGLLTCVRFCYTKAQELKLRNNRV